MRSRDEQPELKWPASAPGEQRPDFESAPLSRAEYIAALAHLYRGEMHRSLVWRVRLDTTTNWAVVATVAILTFSFNNPQYSSETLIAGMYTNLVFLLIEARRFRFFDVWRARLRMIEENFYGPILRRELHSPEALWGPQVADDLLRPRFHISFMQAMKARLMRTFAYMFVFLLLAWIGRVIVIPETQEYGMRSMFGIGALPAWVPITAVTVLYVGLLAVVVFSPKVTPPEISYWPDPNHPGEDVPSLDV
ncbi:MAG: DUF2270 domain-containing protein [Candidatus Krumholzibacteriia bacterium]